jgi:hypothetical protein
MTSEQFQLLLQDLAHVAGLSDSSGLLKHGRVKIGELDAVLVHEPVYKEIGMRLGLAEITVKTHLTAIFRLLGVVNRTQAVVAIRRFGIACGGNSDTSAGARAH